jgi:hypothetical protein
LTNIISITPNVEAVDAEVIITLDEHDIVYLNTNISDSYIYISGNVTCNFDGFGGNVQRIEIYLWVSCQQNWYPGIGPKYMWFYENGKQKFNLSLRFPKYYRNNTMDAVTVYGNWYAEPYNAGVAGGSGSAQLDRVNITYINMIKYNLLDIEEPVDNDSPDYKYFNHYLTVFILIGLPIIISVIVIIVVAKKAHDWYIWYFNK